MSAMNAAVSEAETAALDAQAAAGTAQGYTNTAATYADSANYYANEAMGHSKDANDYMRGANQYASQASGSATQSDNSAASAASSATQAASSAASAEDSATQAANSAKNATNSANEVLLAEARIFSHAVPEAVTAGATELVDKALSREDDSVLRFIAVSDAHHRISGNAYEEISAGTKELGQAVGEILKLIDVDFVANLGDITWGSTADGSAVCFEEGKDFNRLFLDKVRNQTNVWTEGNHETDLLTAIKIHGLIYSHNKHLTQDEKHWIEGYGYIDFPTRKVRVICLNTNQGASGNVSGMSNEQLKWFAEIALDMSGKTDWNVITMGHHPLSYNSVSLMRYAAETVKAFINGDNFSFTTNDSFTFGLDYSDKNCQYIGHFHGHAHAFSVVKMQRYVSSGVYEEFDAWEICIPNACYTRNNQYLNNGQYTTRYSTEETYSKTDEDGNRTSFNLITVCLNNKIIYADNYGAGIDRVVSYAVDETSYTITRNLTNCTSSSSALSVVEGTSHTETLTAADGYTMDGASVTVTMGGVDISSSYVDGVLTVASVTGDIVITASAVVDVPVVTYNNLLDEAKDTDGVTVYGEDYDGDGDPDGYKANTYLSSGNPGSRSGIDCSGFIPLGSGSSNTASGEQVIRFQNITAGNNTNFRIALYKADKTYIQTLYGNQFDSNGYNIKIPYEVDDSGNYTKMDFTAITAHLRDHASSGTTAYFRFCCPDIAEGAIVTVNEPIE